MDVSRMSNSRPYFKQRKLEACSKNILVQIQRRYWTHKFDLFDGWFDSSRVSFISRCDGVLSGFRSTMRWRSCSCCGCYHRPLKDRALFIANSFIPNLTEENRYVLRYYDGSNV